VTLVIALADVVATVVPLVKKLFCCGAVTLVPLVKNVFGVEVALVTTDVSVVVPFKNGTVSKGPTVPGLLGLVHTMLPELLVVVPPLGVKANRAGGALFGALAVMSTAMVRRLGLFVPGVMPVTVPVVALVTTVPVT
jgi:hypothetical protein